MIALIHEGAVVFAAKPPKPPATTVPGSDGKWNIPKIVPDFSGPGIQGVSSIGDWIAGFALVSAGIVMVLGVLIAAVGPRLSFIHSKALGVGGILGGLAIGAVVSLSTDAVGTVGGWF